MEGPSELQDIYYGGKNVEVKTGRYWKQAAHLIRFRNSILETAPLPFDDGRAEQKSVWGDDDSRFNSITKFFLKNFTNYLEKQYYDRPYPISAPVFLMSQ